MRPEKFSTKKLFISIQTRKESKLWNYRKPS
jgi:hypothetical protein